MDYTICISHVQLWIVVCIVVNNIHYHLIFFKAELFIMFSYLKLVLWDLRGNTKVLNASCKSVYYIKY